MNRRRIAGLSRRVMLQIIRDKRTFLLLIAVPILLLLLAALLFESETGKYPVGLVNLDRGIKLPDGTFLSLGEEIEKSIGDAELFSLVLLDSNEVTPALEKSRVKAVLELRPNTTVSFIQSGVLELDLWLEGSNPAISGIIEGGMYQVVITALIRIAAGGIVPALSLNTPSSVNLRLLSGDFFPVAFKTDYYFGGPDFGAMDYVAPVYIAFLVLFFVFLITCVSLVQERTHGTMERLSATPATRVEIILGYFIGLGVYAIMQGALILVFSIFVLKTVYSGSLLLLFLIIVILAVVGVALGMLASSFARNEFQVVQFIPLLIIPQMLLGGTVVPVEDLPAILIPIAYCMPLTYANMALRDVMIKGWGLGQIFPQLIALCGFALILVLLDIVALRRRIG